MTDGIFPSCLKTGKITPIYKKDDEQLLENYRPVSTLPIFGKIFETVIYVRLYSFLTTNGTLHHMPLITQSTKFNKHLNKQITYWVFSLTFDTIDHSIILEKLENYGVRGTTLKLIESYLFRIRIRIYNNASLGISIQNCH